MSINRFDRLMDSLFSKSKNDKLIVMFNLRYSYKLVRLMIVAIAITYFVGCFWYMFCDHFKEINQYSFISKYNLQNKTALEKVIISCYFTLTTLTTVGYGDFVPTNNAERIFAIFIMLLGVAMFSYVMGSFTDLISSYDKKIGLNDKGSDLQNWLMQLGKLNKNKPFTGDLLNKIDKHFVYFWENDRNASLSKDDPYLRSLPKRLRYKIMDFLWGDILLKFAKFFLYFSSNKEQYNKFYYNISFGFMPRRFFPGEMIYKANESIEELYLILDGTIEIGHTLYNDVNSVKYVKNIKGVDYIGEYYCLFNVKSKYYYRAVTEVKILALNKETLNVNLEKYSELYTKFKTKAYRRYLNHFKAILEKKIDEEIEKLNITNNLIQISKLNLGDVSNKIFYSLKL